MNTLKGASSFRVFISRLFKGASTHKTFSVKPKSGLLEKFVKVCNCANNLWLEKIKNCAMKKAKYEIWQEHKKSTHFSSRAGWTKWLYFVGQQILRVLRREFIPNHNNVFRERKMRFLAD